MADVVTRTELEDARVDLQTIEDVVNGAPDLNGDGVVTSRLGREIKTVSRVIQEILEEGTPITGPYGFAEPIVATGSTTLSTYSFVFEEAVAQKCFVSSFTIGLNAASDVTLYAVSLSGTTATVIRSETFTVAAGVQEVFCAFELGSGEHLGVTGSGVKYQAGTSPGVTIYAKQGILETGSVLAISAVHKMEFSAQLNGELRASVGVLSEAVSSFGETLGSAYDLGFSDPIVGTGSNTPGDYSFVFNSPIVVDGVINSVTVGTHSASTITLHAVSLAGIVPTVLRSVSYDVASGVSTIEVALPISSGEYLAVTGGAIKYSAISGQQPLLVKHGSLVTGDVLAAVTTIRMEFGCTLEDGLFGRVAALEGIAGTPQNLVGTGIGLLADADAGGSVDATALFSDACAQHQSPQVPAGAFAVTALPQTGRGLWGAGVPYVGGEAYLAPPSPRNGDLFHGIREALASHIANGDVLTLIGDSISHWAHADTGAKHWFNLLSRFANLGVCKDEPIMTALRPSSTYTTSFYGVAVSGGSTGTAGPIGESLILANGGYLEFVGAYAQIDVFAQQSASAGTLTATFNGASFASKSFAGTAASDVHSGFSATGQTVSGTYRLTASAGPVEITGLIREGSISAATGISYSRLRTLRAAHGSYMFDSFGASQIASVVRMAGHWGGAPLPIIALGINDSFNRTPASIVTNATAMIDALEAGGATRIFGLTPMRPTNVSWNSSYTGGRRYDTALGALMGVYRDRGVRIISASAMNWAGLQSDGLHPNVAGHMRLAQIAAERIAVGE